MTTSPTGRISIKHDRIVPYGSRAKNRINFKWHLLCNHWVDFNHSRLDCFLRGPPPKSLKSFHSAAQCTKWPPELKLEKNSNDISAVTTWQISTKLDRLVPWEVLYHNCSNLSAPQHKMATKAKNRKIFKQHLLSNHWANFNQTSRIVPLGGPLPKKGKRKVQGVPQTLSRHQEEEEADKTKQAQIERKYEKH